VEVIKTFYLRNTSHLQHLISFAFYGLIESVKMEVCVAKWADLHVHIMLLDSSATGPVIVYTSSY